MGEILGSGTFGVVFRATNKATKRDYACKSISKFPKGSKYSNPHHLLKIRSEVDCMKQLGRSLDAVYVVDVFEDEDCVHIMMELCEGGTLMATPGINHMTEHDVAMVMRTVLRFLAQCHSHSLIYRDIKPENFLFTSRTFDRTLKATDFGLMIPHPEGTEPLKVPAGTPIYVAPEVVKRSYSFKADVYSAGVMAFQLLTGRYPYWPSMSFQTPTLTELMKTIANQPIDFSGLEEEGLSPLAQDFLQCLLEKDPENRFSAEEALEHPWVREDGLAEEVPLDGTVVQRLQRWALNGHLKQKVLTMITDDILSGDDDICDYVQSSMLLDPVRDIFSYMDREETGSISYDALVCELTREGYYLSEPEKKQLISCIDTDGDGQIVFDDFASSLLDWDQVQQTLKWKELLLRAFRRLDYNGDGTINLDDLLTLLPSNLPEEERQETAAAMVREFDIDHNGEISWSEFFDLLTMGNEHNTLEFYDRRLSSSMSGSSCWDSLSGSGNESGSLGDSTMDGVLQASSGARSKTEPLERGHSSP